jgi:predicted permease
MAVSTPDYLDWRGMKSFDGIAAYTIQTMNRGILLGQGTPVPVQSAMASHELFPLLGITAFVGRAFTADEEHGKKPVAILSERLWRAHFGADPGIVGRSVRLEQTVFTVVGVVEGRLAFPAWADLWMPLSLLEPKLQGTRKYHPLEVIARLRTDVSEGAAQEELRSLMGTLAGQFPATNGGQSAMLVPMQSYLTAPVRGALWLVWVAVSLVLLIVSVNVAHLVLARTAGRERELAIRVALGATRAHIARLLLTENLLLAACGGTAGVGLATLLMPIASRYASSELPHFERLTLDSNVAAFGFFISVITMAIFCLPALWSSLRPSIRPAMATARRNGIYRVLIAVEVAVAFAVLGGAGLLMRSFERLIAVDPGFETSGRTAMKVILPQPAYDWEKSQRWFEQRLAPRIRSIPGVRSVANGNLLPLSMPNIDQIHRFATRFGVPGETYADGVFPVAQARWVSEAYFQTMGIRLMSGRLLTEADRGLQRYVVNETLARRYFRSQDVAGKQIIFGVADPRQVAVEIVGVVKDVRDLSLELPPEPTIYSLNTSMQFALLVNGVGLKTEALVAAVRELEPDSLVECAGPVDEILRDSLAKRRFSLTIMTAFGAIAALLAALGVFGVVSYAAARRVREFGLRMALGACPSDVRRLIFVETAATAAAGVIAGGVLSQVLVPLSRPLLYETRPWDPLSWVTSAAVVLGASLVASWIPARRASRLDPSTALRRE